MRRGTTPTLTAEVDYDLTGWTVYLTLKHRKGEVELTGDRLTVTKTDEGCTVAATLTQEETLSLPASSVVSVQIRATDGLAAVASEIASVSVESILKDGII